MVDETQRSLVNIKNRVVVLLSGNGSNLQALLDQQLIYSYNIVGVISNRIDAFGLERAKKAGVITKVLDDKKFSSREVYDRELMSYIDECQPSLVVLAGYMRILTSSFVDHYQCKLINIHPSLLPQYKGLNTHRRVVEDKQLLHGTTVHLVSEELDSGAIILQASLSIGKEDDEYTLCNRVKAMEHLVYPMAVGFITSQRMLLSENILKLDGIPIGVKGHQLHERSLII